MLVKKVTALRAGKARRKRVSVFLEGKVAFSLEAEVVVKAGLRVGQELAEGYLEELTGTDRFHRCLNAAMRYLSYRPRSEAELREKLSRRGFADEGIAAVLTRLKEQGLVDDMAFARFWRDNRDSFSPRSQWLTKLELQRKGVDADIIDQVASTIDDDDSAYRTARNKASRLSRADYPDFRRRLGEYLRRRGFGYEVINSTVKRLWLEPEQSKMGLYPGTRPGENK